MTKNDNNGIAGNYVFKIELRGITPKIWRRVKVDPSTSLDEFHVIIQVAMGWRNYSFHKFLHKGKEYYIDPDTEFDDGWEQRMEDGTYMKHNIDLNEMDLKVGDKIYYEYDAWQHNIIFEKIVDSVEDKDERLPVLMAGRCACPPENIGGKWGYARMLELLKTKGEGKHKVAYENRISELYMWSHIDTPDEEFDPKKYDLKRFQGRFHSDIDWQLYERPTFFC